MKKGFTLVELMTVIIILGVLALITYPIVDKSIKQSKEKALDRTIKSIIDGIITDKIYIKILNNKFKCILKINSKKLITIPRNSSPNIYT